MKRSECQGNGGRVLALGLLLVCFTAGCRIAPIFSRNILQTFRTSAPAPKHPGSIKRRDARLAVTWIGHATMLIQMDDRLILTDPIFEESILGLSQRLVKPGITLEEMPPVDAIVVSHMHFDHLSIDSLDGMAAKHGDGRTGGLLVVPNGGRRYVEQIDIPNRELPPFVSTTFRGMTITPVPVKHLGWRYGFDAGTAGESYTGYVIEHHGMKVYFAGDTGFDQAKFEAAAAYGPFDLVLMPIAPVEPREFMQRTHVDPREALAAFRLLGGKVMVPMHYDTFINSADNPGDALAKLEEAKRADPALGARVQALQIGEQRVLISR